MKSSIVLTFAIAILHTNAAAVFEKRHFLNATSWNETYTEYSGTNSSIVSSKNFIEEPQYKLSVQKPSYEHALNRTGSSDLVSLYDTSSEAELILQEEVVTAVKLVVEDVLDAFRDFGDAAGMGFESLLEDLGYKVEVSPEKCRLRGLHKRGFFSVLKNILRAILNGVSVVTSVLAESSPELEFIGSTASAFRKLL